MNEVSALDERTRLPMMWVRQQRVRPGIIEAILIVL